MKRFIATYFQDLILAYRSGHVLITGLLLVIMLALVIFLPKQVVVHNEVILDTTSNQELANFLAEKGISNGVVYTNETDFFRALEKQPNKVGVIFKGGKNSPVFEIITKNAVAEENIHLLKVSLDQVILAMRDVSSEKLPVEFLRPISEPIAFNVKFIPIVIVFEVVLLGFLIAAVMMFQEKQEGTMRAYRVTPSGALNYIFSKNALFFTLSLAYGLPILLVAFGLKVNYGLVLLLILLSSSLMTMFSLAVAVFFRNLSEWFFVGVAVLIINQLPIISYGMPSFSPAWITWVPSYPTVFAVRDVLFNGAKFVDIQGTIIYLVLLNITALGVAYVAIRFKLLKEGR